MFIPKYDNIPKCFELVCSVIMYVHKLAGLLSCYICL